MSGGQVVPMLFKLLFKNQPCPPNAMLLASTGEANFRARLQLAKLRKEINYADADRDDAAEEWARW